MVVLKHAKMLLCIFFMELIVWLKPYNFIFTIGSFLEFAKIKKMRRMFEVFLHLRSS